MLSTNFTMLTWPFGHNWAVIETLLKKSFVTREVIFLGKKRKENGEGNFLLELKVHFFSCTVQIVKLFQAVFELFLHSIDCCQLVSLTTLLTCR